MENDAESNTNPISQGCGSNNHISVQISPTTGGDFALTVDPSISIESLKKMVSKKLKVPRDRICLLFREKQLQEGNLQCNGVTDGSKITLLPNVETGLIGNRSWHCSKCSGVLKTVNFMRCLRGNLLQYIKLLFQAQKPEIGIMQALESLNDTQVNDFLCGKAPLNLTMRLGDHMMLIQLQLSTVQSSRHSQSPRSPSPTRTSTCPCRPPSLTQASRNLQHTLRRLSADVLSGRDDWATSQTDSRRGSIYSGTFSGALNPALQDTRGRPRRDVATIVHILNDLLCSAPAAELRRVSRRSHSATASVPAPSTNGESNTSSEKTTFSSTITKPAESESTTMKAEADWVQGSSSSANDSSSSTGQWEDTSEDQNSRTRGKLEQLRLVMGERRERRKQRKQKVQPYSLPIPVSVAAESPPSDTVSA